MSGFSWLCAPSNPKLPPSSSELITFLASACPFSPSQDESFDLEAPFSVTSCWLLSDHPPDHISTDSLHSTTISPRPAPLPELWAAWLDLSDLPLGVSSILFTYHAPPAGTPHCLQLCLFPASALNPWDGYARSPDKWSGHLLRADPSAVLLPRMKAWPHAEISTAAPLSSTPHRAVSHPLCRLS